MTDPDLFTVPQGSFALSRLHDAPGSPLRAWDAADAYVLDHLGSVDLHGRSVAIVNDAHGALTVALAEHRPTVMSDSFVAHLATVANLQRNGFRVDAATAASTLDPVAPGIDLAIVKVPKSIALLDHQLRALAPHLTADAVVVGAGMTRHVHASTLDAFERSIGPTTTSLARRKARLIHAVAARRDPDPGSALGTDPVGWPRFTLPSGTVVVSGPGVFAAGKLDIGTRLLLDHLSTRPVDDGPTTVIDLGCGNGVVGTTIARRNPSASVTFVDESYLAIASARATVSETALAGRAADHATVDGSLADRCRFLVGDALATGADVLNTGAEALDDALDTGGTSDGSIATASADLVVINPPFHDDHAVGDAIAWRMFTGARRVLRPGGEILVVGNRHLGYHAKIRRLFGNGTVVTSNPKFVVISAIG